MCPTGYEEAKEHALPGDTVLTGLQREAGRSLPPKTCVHSVTKGTAALKPLGKYLDDILPSFAMGICVG